MNVAKRIEIEKKVIRKLIRTARAHGYLLVRIWDGESNETPTTEAEALEVVFSVDECTMRFRHNSEAKTHCAVIVLGNDGWDCIADSSVGPGWDAVMDEMDTFCNKLAEAA